MISIKIQTKLQLIFRLSFDSISLQAATNWQSGYTQFYIISSLIHALN